MEMDSDGLTEDDRDLLELGYALDQIEDLRESARFLSELLGRRVPLIEAAIVEGVEPSDPQD